MKIGGKIIINLGCADDIDLVPRVAKELSFLTTIKIGGKCQEWNAGQFNQERRVR